MIYIIHGLIILLEYTNMENRTIWYLTSLKVKYWNYLIIESIKLPIYCKWKTNFNLSVSTDKMDVVLLARHDKTLFDMTWHETTQCITIYDSIWYQITRHDNTGETLGILYKLLLIVIVLINQCVLYHWYYYSKRHDK